MERLKSYSNDLDDEENYVHGIETPHGGDKVNKSNAVDLQRVTVVPPEDWP